MSYLSSDVLSSIKGIYSKNPVRPGFQDHIELEIRFGEYSIPPKQTTYFDPRTRQEKTHYETRREITNITYSKLLENLKIKPVITDVTDCSMGKIRRSVNNITGETTWIQKTSIFKEDIRQYRIRVNVSSEDPINPVINFISQHTRRKLRRTYLSPTGFQIDLTEVTTTYKNNLVKTYEVEIEATRRDLSIENINDGIGIILRVIQDTEIIYTERDYFEIINYVNTSLDGRPGKYLDDKVYYQPRNLHFKDLVYGGIVGNKSEVYKVTWKTDGLRKLLVMSPKGIWLVWAPSEVNLLAKWTHPLLIGSILEGEHVPLERRFFKHPEKPRMKYADYFDIREDKDSYKSMIAGYTLDLPQKYWFLGFDALARSTSGGSSIRGDNSIQTRPHKERMSFVQFFKDKLYDGLMSNPLMGVFQTRTFSMNTKEFKAFKNPPEFFSVMRYYDSLAHTLTYDIDGYIFMPENMAYNSGNDKKKPLSSRVLTKFSDICKYKPAEDMTIDFAILWKEGSHSLLPLESLCAQGSINPTVITPLSDRKLILQVSGFDQTIGKTRSVQYYGSDKKILTEDMIDIDNPLTREVPSETVVEYRWDKDNEKLTPMRIRYDKKYPNLKEVADDNWNLIFIPIPIETLLGNNIQLVRRYHNKIKEGLFTQSSQRHIKNIGPKPSLLDIGSGWGGDLTKWKNFGNIIAVEPNLDHIRRGLIPRINDQLGQPEVAVISKYEDIDILIPAALRRGDRIIIINTGGENTKLITATTLRFLGRTGGKVDVVSMMLSLSFFWESSQILDALVNTIGQNLTSNGEFIFFTVNGDTVEEMFNPKLGNGSQIQALWMGPPEQRSIEMRVDIPDRKVWINIPNTIVEDQTEWLVKIDDLQIRLEKYGFSLRSIERADKEGFLTQAERVYTTMYSYGSFTPSSENKAPRIVEELVDRMTTDDFDTASGRVMSLPVSPEIKTSPSSVLSSPSKITSPSYPSMFSPSKIAPDTLKSVIITEDTIKTPDIGGTLPFLPVDTSVTDADDRAIGDDVSQVINCQWYNQYPVVRIAAIGDGSCFIHSVLKSYSTPYANNPSVKNRVDLALGLRRDLAYTLQLPDPENTIMRLYDSFNGGIFPELAKSDPNFTLDNLQRTINSSGWLGDEIFEYATQRLGVNVIVMTPTSNNLVRESGGDIDQLRSPFNIFIGHVGECHYETLGIYIEGEGIRTVFDGNDPFMIAYYSWRILDEIRSDLNTIIRKIQLYQTDISSQLVGIDLNEYLSSDQIFTGLRRKLFKAQKLFQKSQDLQDKAIGGSDMKTLKQLRKNKRKMNSYQIEISRVV
jgi:hypothetical protein